MSITRVQLPAHAICDTRHGDKFWTLFQANASPAALVALKKAAQAHADTTGHQVDLYLTCKLEFAPPESEAAAA